jgi:uncharacterized protein (DUF488 family)
MSQRSASAKNAPAASNAPDASESVVTAARLPGRSARSHKPRGPARIQADPSTVYTVGYEGRDVADLIALLRTHRVETLVDVRLTPISRKAGFSKTALSSALADAGITYLHERRLGNPKENRPAYRAGEKTAQRRYLAHLLQNGGDAVARLSDIVTTSATALLCVEREPSICHRSAVADQLGVSVVSL